MNHYELKIKRLESEQMLVLQSADDLVNSIAILLKHTCMDGLSESSKIFILQSQVKFIRVMESLIEGS